MLKEFAFGLKKAKVKVEWLSFLVFLGIPVTTLCIAVFAGRQDWWEITSLVWFYLIGLFFFLYAVTLILTAVHGSFVVTRNWRDILDDGIVNDSADFWETLSQAIQTRNHHYFSGLLTFSYFTEGSIDRSGVHRSRKHIGPEINKPGRSLWTRFVSLGFMDFLFEDVTTAMKAQGYNVTDIGETLQKPSMIGTEGIELFDMEDVQGFRPFLTRDTWSLEKIFCRDRKSRYVVVYDGPDAVTKAQMNSSIACYILGNGFGVVVLAAALHWFGAPAIVITIVVIGYFLFHLSTFMSAGSIINIIREINLRDEDEEDEDGKSMGLFQVWRRFRVRQPKRISCFFIFGMELTFLFLWPLFTLYFIGNHKTATVFLILGFVTFVRSYFDPAIVLEETNQISYVDIPDQPNETELEKRWSDDLKYSKSHWTKQSRLAKIVNSVNRSKFGPFWFNALTFFLFVLVGLLAIATATKGEKNFDLSTNTYLKDFYYEQQKDLPYPTCNIGKGEMMGLNGASSLRLSDYVFVAGLAYSDPTVTQPQLDKWFGEGSARDENKYVEKHRAEVNDRSAVTYKLISFDREKGKKAMGLISIRGTTTAWDALTDIQLWSAAAIFQMLRELLPGGQVFSPILNHLVNMISWLASESINRKLSCVSHIVIPNFFSNFSSLM